MVNSPLIRPAISWGGGWLWGSLGGVPKFPMKDIKQLCDVKEFSTEGDSNSATTRPGKRSHSDRWNDIPIF